MRTRWAWLRRAHPARPWTNMAPPLDKKVAHCLAAGCSIILGNGEQALFWTDNWMPGKGLISLSMPILFSFVQDKKRSVAESLQDNRWVDDIRGGLLAQALVEFFALWDFSLSPNSRARCKRCVFLVAVSEWRILCQVGIFLAFRRPHTMHHWKDHCEVQCSRKMQVLHVLCNEGGLFNNR